MEEFEGKVEQVDQEHINCTDCGAELTYAPGTSSLTCEYCGAENKIETANDQVREIDFMEFLAQGEDSADKTEVVTVKCEKCAADTTFDPNQTAGSCAFCGAPLILDNATTHSIIKPESLLPFVVTRQEAFQNFRTWIKKLWFAPNNLSQYAQSEKKLTGMYLPYWTYDSDTNTNYTGMRGIDYTVTENYTTTENGQTVTRTRSVTKTRWYPVSGHVQNMFDDVLVVASNSLKKEYVEQLEPWNLQNLVNFDDKFLSGFRAESYQVNLKDGFEYAKQRMDPVIKSTIRSHIGGDRQRILTMHTSYSDITFKHILLPVYVSGYWFKNKLYQIMVNGTTGEVTGERPWSWIKITLAVLLALAVIATVIILIQTNGG